MGDSRFTITTIVENGYPHYKVHDNLTDNEIHCDLNELNETIWQLLGVQGGVFMADYRISYIGDNNVGNVHHIGVDFNGNYYSVIFGK